MDTDLKVFYNPSVEEEYQKYIGEVKQEFNEKDNEMFRARYFQIPVAQADKEFRKKLIGLIISSSQTNPSTKWIINYVLEEERRRKDKPQKYSVEDLIELNLNNICYMLLDHTMRENENLREQVRNFLLRQPVRIMEVEKGKLHNVCENALDKI